MLLEFLVVTATESIERPKQDLSVDEERLTQALEDVEAVKACWVFLTYAMAVRSAGYAFTADAGLEQSMYEDVGALVETLWPRPPEEEATIDAGLDAENLGYWSLEWVYTRHAFWLLIGEAVDQLALFRELEPAIDLRLLEIAWDGGGHVLDHVIETATYDFRGGPAY